MSDETTLRAELERHLGPVPARELAAHVARGAVFVVADDRSLLDCGVAVARDDRGFIEALLHDGALRRLDEVEQREIVEGSERTWTVLIVQPFVFIQAGAN